jgi:citrate lyase beta subunit
VRTLHCNPVRSPWFEDDIVEVVGETGEQLDSVFISGCETGEEVRDVQTILRNVQHAAGRRNRIFLEVVIDSPRAFTDMEAIAALEDVTSLVFSANFARALGASPPNGHSRLDLVTAREMLPIVAAAHGKLAVDGVTRPVPQEPTARDEALALIAEDSRISAEQGYSAAWISSHAAIDVIQSAWTPTRERALLALKTAVSYGESKVRPAQHALPDRRAVIADWPSVRHAHTAGILSDEDFAEHGCTLNELEHAIQS